MDCELCKFKNLHMKKKPKYIMLNVVWGCPTCSRESTDAMLKPNYCSRCGQAIDWDMINDDDKQGN